MSHDYGHSPACTVLVKDSWQREMKEIFAQRGISTTQIDTFSALLPNRVFMVDDTVLSISKELGEMMKNKR